MDQGITLLKQSLPTSWNVQLIEDPPGDPLRTDAVLSLGATGQAMARVVVEARRSFEPKDVQDVANRVRFLGRVAGDVPFLVIAPWFSDRSQRLLMDAGINYLDLVGNVRLTANYPALYVHRQSQAPPPKRASSVPSLKGVKAGRVVRLLADVSPPYGVHDLARYAAVTPGYVSRLLDMLEREALVARSRRGAVERTDWRGLLERRAETYGVFSSNALESYVCPNGPAYALEVARDLRLPHVALSGSFAAGQIVSAAPPALLLLYATSDTTGLVGSAGLLPADSGANVVIATPYDSVVMDRQYPLTASLPPLVPLVALSQIALDCMTGNGRMPQEGAALLDWMAQNEDQWRIKSLSELSIPEAVQ
jgi:hypothetical protein